MFENDYKTTELLHDKKHQLIRVNSWGVGVVEQCTLFHLASNYALNESCLFNLCWISRLHYKHQSQHMITSHTLPHTLTQLIISYVLLNPYCGYSSYSSFLFKITSYSCLTPPADCWLRPRIIIISPHSKHLPFSFYI